MTNSLQNPIIDELNVFNDTTPGSLPGALKVSGFTSNIPNGTEISILISDSEGNVTTAIVVVEDGAFELVNIDTSMLKPGDLNVNASVNDFTIGVDHARVIPPEVTPISVTETVLDVNNKISIEGTTKGFAPGQVLNLVVRDTNGTSVTATAAVQSNGSFSVSGISTQGLADGTLIVDVLAQTSNGSVSIENADNVQLTNLVPQGTNNTLAVNEDTARVLTVADFGYVQGNNNFAMTGIKIAGLTSVGTLKLNGNALLMDDFVSLAQINAGQLVFQGAQDGNGTAYDSFKFKVLDNRPTYNEDPTAKTITFNVTPINDVPVLTTAGAIGTINEDSASATAVNLWSTAPVYAAGPSNEASQTLSYKITAIPAFITLFKADGTTAVTAGTTVTAIEFAGLQYKTVGNANGTGNVTFDVIDSGSGTAPNVNTLSSQSISMTVNAVNDAPVLATGSTLAYTENNVATAINTAITVADADNATLTTATVSITGGFVTGQDVLSFATAGAATMGNIVGSYSAATGVMTLTSAGGTATLAQWQAALRAVAYNNTSDAPSTAARTVSYTVNDGTVNGNTVTSTINVTAVNDAPVLATGSTLAYTENNVATAINTAITVADADNAALTTATVSITGGFVTGQDVLSFTTAGAATMGNIVGSYSAATGVMTLTSAGGTATLAQWQAALRAVAYNNTSDAPSTAARTVSYAVNDGTVSGNTVTSTINLTAVNDAPVLADTTLNLTAVIQGSANPVGAVGVLVSSLVGGVSDVDAGAEKGIAITGFNSAKGQLFFSTNGGTNWTEITSATEATARLLKSDTDNRVYFKAAAGTQGTVADAVTFRAWDATTGTEGLTGDAAANGGTTAFSTATDTVSSYVVAPVTINAVSTDDLVNVSEPLLITGKADSNAVVTLNINGQNFNVTANATGDWSYDGSKVRYVMVRKTLMNLPTTDPDYNLKGILTIGEVEIFQRTTNTNLSTLPGVSQSYSNVNTFTTGSLLDMNAYYTAGSYVETSGSQMGLATGVSQDAWVQIDLGAAYSLNDIKLMGAQNTSARLNGATIYTSATDMSALTKAQLDSSVLVNKGTPVTGLTNAGWQGYWASSDSPDAIYGNALNEGPNTITATELVQGVSSQATRVVTLDTIAPVTTVTSAALSSDTGTSNTDFITSVAAQTITGNLSANLATGEKVMVSLDNGVTWTAATAAVGTSTWSLTGVTLSGTNTLRAKVEDTAGNGSTPFTKVYALVTVSDLTVGITRIEDNAGTATNVLSGGTSNDTTPTLVGTLGGATQGAALGTNEVVTVYRTPNLAAATVVNHGSLAGEQILSGNALTHLFVGDGNYGPTGNVYLPTTPGNGHMVVITKTANWGISVFNGSTLVGNVGTAGVPSGGQDNLYFKWDAAQGQWLTGTNALTKVGTAVVTTNAAGQSTWALTDNTGLGNSDSVNYIAQVENTAGTFGRQSTPGALDWRYNVDNVAPSSITLIGTDDVAPVAGTITANTVTNDDKPTFSGITEANAVVRVFDGATLLGTTTASGTGAWSFTPTTAMTTGAHSVTATATDAHGNTSAPSTALPFSIDTTAPVAVADTNTGTEDITTPLTGNVGANDTSKDGSETFALVSSATGAKGTLTLNANGSYTYTRTSPADEITANLVETFTYRVTDAAGNTTQSTLTITLTPVNDAATFTGDINKTITETNAAQTVGGTLTVADVDSPTTVVAQTAVNGSAGFGKFTISTAGVWSYTMNTAQNQFVAGQTYDDKLTVTTADGTQQEIKVTITGTNDAPTMASSSSTLGLITFVENGAAIVARGGSITLADVDSANLQGATVRVVNFTDATSFVPGDLLTYTIPGGSGITGAYNTSTGVLTFTGTATQAQYQSLLNSVMYSNLREDLAGGGRNVYWSVKDASGANSNEVLSRLSVSRLNDAPVLADTNLNLTTIEPTTAENLPTGQMGVLVSTLVGGVTDGDGTGVAKGIAVIGANDALGKVFFSVDNGANWFSPAGTISSNAALLLKADGATRVYFRPNAGVEGNIPDAMTIRAWDTTDNKVSLVSNNVSLHAITAIGGITAYSANTDTVALSVLTTASPGLSGTSVAEPLTGTAGNDVIVGNGGADLIDAKEGNDKVVLNNSNVAALIASSAPNIDGGTGVNILKLTGTEVSLDLTNATVQSNVDNFSVVDITSNVNNQLKLNLQNVQNLSAAADNANTPVDESKMLVVHADTGDAVVLQDAASWSVVNSLSGTSLNTIYGANYGFSSTRRYSQYSKDGATLFVDELAPVADIVGTSGNNTLTGTASAEVIYGNGGVDTINAGAGNDTVILTASSISALNAGTNTAAINGEAGVNTLKISGINQTLDLTNLTVNNKLDNFNVIDLKQGSGNKFKLHLDQVLTLAGGADNAATAIVDESKMLVLQGNGGQQVNRLQLVDAVDWTSVTNLGGTSLQNTFGAAYGFEAGRSYTQYTNGAATLFVDQTLFVESL